MMEEKKPGQLSKGLLDMKFMKKTKDRVEKDADDAIGNAMYSHEITDDMRKKGDFVYIEASMAHCLDLMDGRVSFGGMNPAIERLMKESDQLREAELEKAKEKEISDAEMASQVQQNVSSSASSTALAGNIDKRFKTKKERQFLKPSEDDDYD